MSRTNEFEQQQLLTLYGRLAQHRCNWCRLPIFIDEFYVQDPKGGYYPKPKDTPDFLSPQPKVVYHQKCNELRLGKPPKDHVMHGLAIKIQKGGLPVNGKRPRGTKEKKPDAKAQQAVLDLLARKPLKRYWNKGKIARVLFKKLGLKKSKASQAVKQLLAEGKLAKHNVFYTIKKGS